MRSSSRQAPRGRSPSALASGALASTARMRWRAAVHGTCSSSQVPGGWSAKLSCYLRYPYLTRLRDRSVLEREGLAATEMHAFH